MNILLSIVLLGVLCLLLEIVNRPLYIAWLTTIGLLAVLVLIGSQYGTVQSSYNNMLHTNNFSHAFSALFVVLTIYLIALSSYSYKEHPTKISDYIALKIFLLAGAVVMVSFGNLTMFFLGLEVLSIALYILAASDRTNIKSNEAGLKYFLMGAFASGILLFGICLIYGATGSFNIVSIAQHTHTAPAWFSIGVVMIIIAMLFKIAIVPFHFWAPDVYEGAPLVTTATMSTIAKVAAMAALYKLLLDMKVEINHTLQVIISVIVIASMLLGNIMGLMQTNVKRMLAFSGISHAGFMLMTLLMINNTQPILLYYATAYALAGIAAFAVLIYVCKDSNTQNIADFNGLATHSPTLAAVLSMALLSLTGIPIFAGFFAKFILFSQLIAAGYLGLVIVAIISSIISIGYYFRIIVAIYTQEPITRAHRVPIVIYAVAITAILLNILAGLFPSLLLDLLK